MLDARTFIHSFIHSFIHTLYLSTPKTSVTIIDNWNNITDLHVFRVAVLGRGVGGRGHNSIDDIFKRDKRSGHPFITGKTIPQMGPTAADTSLKEFSAELE